MRIRPNFAEGKFYPDNAEEIIQILQKALHKESASIDYSLSKHLLIGGVVPHAGYVYSAPQAVHFFDIVKESKQVFDVVILVNPNHHGQGLPASVDDFDAWQTPLGTTLIDNELALHLGLPRDIISQKNEHSGEVILPYIQYFMEKNIKLLPISFGAQNYQNAELLGKMISESCEALNRKALFIASSDFNHFALPEVGKALDDYALKALLNGDCKAFDQRIHQKDISICGYGAIMALYFYARDRFSDFEIKVLRQGHSGETHPMKEVVDYISLLFYRE